MLSAKYNIMVKIIRICLMCLYCYHDVLFGYEAFTQLIC